MIYLDHAATSFPKPKTVQKEVLDCIRKYGGNPGHASHRLAMAAAEKIYECRVTAADFFDSDCPQNVIFTSGATSSINLFLKGFCKDGDHVLISDMEHNAVYRTVFKLASDGLIGYDVFETFPNDTEKRDEKILCSIAEKVRPNTRLIICSHSSNICSATLPIQKIGAFCRKREIVFAVDGAQSAGRLPISIKNDFIDALCLPGHKGLLGIQGAGMLLLRNGLLLDTLMEGGNGLYSLEPTMPDELPERYESGTLPTPAIAGLLAGMKTVRKIGVSQIASHEVLLTKQLKKNLSVFPHVHLLAPNADGSIVSFTVDGFSADRLGEQLDKMGFCVRTGFHCSALGHRTLCTPNGGAVRVSVGYSNSMSEIHAFSDALESVLAK